jgi:hypothetical protein
MELLIILIVLAIFLFAFAMLIVFYKWLVRRGFRKLAIIIPAMIIAVVGYGAYVSLGPPDSFYKEDFEKYSGMKFPSSGEIIKKYATYPDLHGEYISVALIHLSSSDYQELKEELNRGNRLAVDTAEYPFLGNTFKFLGDSSQRANKNFAVVYRIFVTRKSCVIGYYKNGNTLLFQQGG